MASSAISAELGVAAVKEATQTTKTTKAPATTALVADATLELSPII